MARKVWFSLGLLILSAAPVAAQEGVLLELYGKGVHAYFAGKSSQALYRFNTAINAGSTDPRVFYYRGLTYLQLGDASSAQQDFAKAGELEVADSDEFYDVSRSLERIQGPTRLEIEEYRLAARVNALQRARQLQYERYERIRRAEPNVTIPPEVEEPAPPVAEPPVEEAEPAPSAEEPAAPADPFAPAEELTEEPPAAEESAMEEPAAEPAAEEPAAEEAPAADAPAADAPTEEMPADEPAADAPASDDPAAEPAAEEPAAEEPAATEPAAEEPAAETPAEPDAPQARLPRADVRIVSSQRLLGSEQLAAAGWRLFLLHPPVNFHHWASGSTAGVRKDRVSRY